MYPPHAKLTRLVDAAAEPVTLAQARQFLRINDDDTGIADDDLISAMITAARLVCESLNDRSFITTTWKLTLDYLPFAAAGGILGPALFGFPTGDAVGDDGAITLPMPPLIGLTSISYVDNGGTVRSLDVTPGAGQVIVSPGTPGRVAPAFGTFFPFSRPSISAVDIVYTAGYGAGAADVPASVALAIRLLVSHFYEHRSLDAPAPSAVASLLNATRWGGYA
jgi:hypothetical protein